MKKFLFILFGLFVIMGAFAAGENIPTSKSYVDAAVAQKQDKISASIIIPAGYTQLLYIESTGTQWIDTGVVFNSGIGYELEYRPLTTNNFVIQAGTTGQVIAQQGNVWEFRFNGSINRNPSPSGIDLTQFVNIKYNIDNKCSVDNRIVYIGDLTLNTGGSIRLFGPKYASSGRMSFFLIYDNGVLVNNLVPVRRDSDNVVGMYDTISGQFFTNSGTGEFIAGPVITPGNQVLTNTGTAGEYGTKGIYDATGEYATQQNNLVDAVTMNTAVQNAIDSEFQCIEWLDPNDHTSDCLLLQLGGITEYTLPTEYTALEYIESTGTQWIDTGVYYAYSDTGTAKIDIKFDSLSYVGANPYFQISKSGQCLTIDGEPNTCISPYVRNGLIHTWANGISRLYKDDDTLIQQRGWGNYGNVVYSIFYIGNSQPISSGRIYGLALIKNDVLVRNMIPVSRDNGAVLGMYDTVSNTFFTNAGTGEFIAGPVANLYLPTGE